MCMQYRGMFIKTFDYRIEALGMFLLYSKNLRLVA